MVGDKNRGHETHDNKTERINQRRTTNDEPEALAHGREICCNIDCVGNDKQTNQ